MSASGYTYACTCNYARYLSDHAEDFEVRKEVGCSSGNRNIHMYIRLRYLRVVVSMLVTKFEKYSVIVDTKSV